MKRNQGKNNPMYGVAPWNKGRTGVYSKETIERIRLNTRGEKSSQWVGDNVSYIGLHNWINNQLGKPSLCENCETTSSKRFDWANISGEYKRDLDDWVRLCRRCHTLVDGIGKHLRNRL